MSVVTATWNIVKDKDGTPVYGVLYSSHDQFTVILDLEPYDLQSLTIDSGCLYDCTLKLPGERTMRIRPFAVKTENGLLPEAEADIDIWTPVLRDLYDHIREELKYINMVALKYMTSMLSVDEQTYDCGSIITAEKQLGEYTKDDEAVKNNIVFQAAVTTYNAFLEYPGA